MPLGERGELSEPRLRREVEPVARGPQHAEQPAHLLQGLRPVVSIWRSTCVVCGRPSPRASRSAPAWTVIIEIEWPTTSCSSRAMRARSSATA